MATTKPRKIKVFVVEGGSAWINSTEREALGLDTWIRQASVLVSAPTKAAALAALAAAGHHQTANMLRLSDGGEIGTLTEAGVFELSRPAEPRAQAQHRPGDRRSVPRGRARTPPAQPGRASRSRAPRAGQATEQDVPRHVG